MTARIRIAIVLLCAAAPLLGAQAPRISAAGDPSVDADSIYKLAVDPAKYPEEDAAYLLDDGVVRLEADGRGTKTFRQIIQVMSRARWTGCRSRASASRRSTRSSPSTGFASCARTARW